MKSSRHDKARKVTPNDTDTIRQMTGLERGYRAPSKKVWNEKRWDTKCKAPFADYKPKQHPRLS